MIGNLTDNLGLTGTLQTNLNITGILNTNDKITGTIVDGETHRQYYVGENEITPQLERQVLETKETIMPNNIVIKPIPYEEVPNQYGDTVYIGTEV